MWSAQTMCIFVEWTRVYCKLEHIFLNVCYFVLFSRMGACQCWHLPSFYLSSDESAYCFLGKYCLIRQSLAFKHCFFPTYHDPVRIEQRHFFFHLQPTSCLKHLNRHSTLTVLLGRTPMRLNNCELWWVLCLKISFWIMSHGFLECGWAMNAELKDCGQWAAACQYYCMPLQSSNKRKALDAIH